MAEFPAMPLWTDAYLGDTSHLTTLEHGAYLLLLIAMWRTKAKSLPDDDRLLARYAKLTAGQWKRIKPIIEAFFDIESGVWTQGRLTDEAEAVRQHSKKQSDKAKRRWLKTKKTSDAAAMPEGMPEACSLTLTLTPSESDDSLPPKPPKGGRVKSEDFCKFWEAYPRKQAKKGAEKKFAAAVKSGVDPSQIIAGAEAYAAHCLRERTEAQFVKLPTTWLNNGCWEDVLVPKNGAAVPVAKEVSLDIRVERAADWLSRNDSIPAWMDRADTAQALVERGHDYDTLRRAGFSLPVRGNVVDIRGMAPTMKRG